MKARNKNFKLFVIVLAGGGGTRLWPVSRRNTPKQMLPFIGQQTLLQTTMKRVRGIVPESRIFIVTNIRHKKDIEKQMPRFPKKNILFEPEKRDTAAAIAFAVAVIHARQKDAVVTTVNADQYIQNEKEYKLLIKKAAEVAYHHKKHSVLIGVNPTYPETGYGYIKMAGRFNDAKDPIPVFQVDSFVEKPDLPTAKKYIKRWDYLWNPAFFFWHIETLVQLFKKYLPRHAKAMQAIEASVGKKNFQQVVDQVFPALKPISIDYGIMEKKQPMLVVPANFGWADIGHWRSVKDVLSKNHTDNVIKGLHVGVDTDGSLIYGYSNRLIATIGIRDFVIVDTPDVLLICPKDQSQDVKKVVELIHKKGLTTYV